MQQQGSQLRLIQCGSRFISDTESRYSITELEMLAVVWAIKKCHVYLFGMKNFTIRTDHRPLLSILNKQTFDQLPNPRILRMREKIQAFNFTVKWIKDKENIISDAPSRSPAEDNEQNGEEIYVLSVIHYDTTDPILKEVEQYAEDDPDYQLLMKYIVEGFPSNLNKLSDFVKSFHQLQQHLSLEGKLALLGTRIIIPQELQKEVVSRLHSLHQGIEKTKRRARETVYWPGINEDIAITVKNCDKCRLLRPSHCKEPMITNDAPTRVFEVVSSDLFIFGGRHYLVYVDILSGWPVV